MVTVLDATVRDGEEAEIHDAAYLRLFGWEAGPLRASELWSHLVTATFDGEEPTLRAAIDTILDEGPLARRLLRAIGSDPGKSVLLDVYGELCDCLRQGRQLRRPR